MSKGGEATGANGRNDEFQQRVGTTTYWNLGGKRAIAPPIEHTPPIVQEVGPAILTPRRYPPKMPGPRKGALRIIEGGIYDGEGRLLPAFADRQSHDERAQAGNRLRNDPEFDPARTPVEQRLEGSYAYLGLMRGHFGHFLLESLCRLWYLLKPDPGVRLLFHGEHGLEQMPSFVRHIFDLLEIDADRVTVVDRVAAIEHLLIPDSSFEIRWKARAAHAASFAELFDRNLKRCGHEATPERVYLTRRSLDVSDEASARKQVMNEARVERMFAKRGFEVVAPEKLPFPYQIALAGQARHLAGLKGSALHMSLFGQQPDLRLIQLDKSPSINQVLIDGLKGTDSHHIICKRPRDEGGFLVDTDALKQALQRM